MGLCIITVYEIFAFEANKKCDVEVSKSLGGVAVAREVGSLRPRRRSLPVHSMNLEVSMVRCSLGSFQAMWAAAVLSGHRSSKSSLRVGEL